MSMAGIKSWGCNGQKGILKGGGMRFRVRGMGGMGIMRIMVLMAGVMVFACSGATAMAQTDSGPGSTPGGSVPDVTVPGPTPPPPPAPPPTVSPQAPPVESPSGATPPSASPTASLHKPHAHNAATPHRIVHHQKHTGISHAFRHVGRKLQKFFTGHQTIEE